MATNATVRPTAAASEKGVPARLFTAPMPRDDTDPALPVAPPRPSGSLTVQLVFAGRAKPLPTDDPELAEEDAV